MATISELLAVALKHHTAGRLEAAEEIYRRVLAEAPDHPEALHLLGTIAHQAGQHEAAVQYIERAIKLKGDVPSYHNNLGRPIAPCASSAKPASAIAAP